MLLAACKEIANETEFTVTFENLALQQSSDDEQLFCISGPLSLSADIAQTMVTLKEEGERTITLDTDGDDDTLIPVDDGDKDDGDKDDGDEEDESKDSGPRSKGR